MKKGDTIIHDGITYTVYEVGQLHNGNGRGYYKAISECETRELSNVL